jgi:hypothetical protein
VLLARLVSPAPLVSLARPVFQPRLPSLARPACLTP